MKNYSKYPKWGFKSIAISTLICLLTYFLGVFIMKQNTDYITALNECKYIGMICFIPCWVITHAFRHEI